MRICPDHWSKLRAAIDARGLGHTVAANGREAFARAVADLEGKADLSDFDALMAAHNMLWSRAMEVLGLNALRAARVDGKEPCPVCDLLQVTPPPPPGFRYRTNDEYFIDGPADSVLEFARAHGIDKPLPSTPAADQ